MFYTWLGIIILLTILEISTVNLVCIWFIISGFLTLLVSNNNLPIKVDFPSSTLPQQINLNIFFIKNNRLSF